MSWRDERWVGADAKERVCLEIFFRERVRFPHREVRARLTEEELRVVFERLVEGRELPEFTAGPVGVEPSVERGAIRESHVIGGDVLLLRSEVGETTHSSDSRDGASE